MRSKVKSIVDGNAGIYSKIFDLTIVILILISLVSFAVETMPGLSTKFHNSLSSIELITVAIFTLEYLIRIWVADKRPKFIFSLYGLIDLLAILPFYFMLGVDLRGIRTLRVLRVLRLFKLVRYNAAMSRFYKALILCREEMVLFLLMMFILLFISSIGIYYFENPVQPDKFSSFFTSLWWAIATVTTVGYGDVYPITTGGRFFTFVILIIGLGVIAIPSGLIAAAFTKVREDEKINNF